jgi:tRNA pseudouridine55 synthase
MARPRKHLRNVHGLLLLDKPVGISSNDALQRTKRLYRARKAGHTGSLDPIASGLLVICFGEATKLSAFLLEADKHYRTVFRLGVRTETGDAEGEVIETRPVEGLDRARVEAVLARFRGEIQQVPPMYSAIKRQGRRLYELAREGVQVAREPRTVHIHRLDLLRLDGDLLELDIVCSKGTYIRTLAEDIGEALGCGAHVHALRRLGVGPFHEGQGMHTLDELEARAQEGLPALDELLLPLDTALADRPAVHLTADMAFYARSGQPVLVPGAPTEGLVRLYDEHESFLGVGRALDDGRIGPKRLVFTR